MVRERDQAITIRMSKDEIAMLKSVSDQTGLSSSDVIRQLIRREHAALADRNEQKKKRR
jgi:hypothetical protein